MKILLCQNYYQQSGGEHQVFEDEASLLESRGHEVLRFTRHNDAIHQMSHWNVAKKTLWNRQVYKELRGFIRQHQPSIMHCTNTFPLISPSAYYAAKAEGVAVVQSLHNFRLFCPGAFLLRDGRVCEDCLTRMIPWPGIVHRCYRNSMAASTVLSSMLMLHRMMRTWRRTVDRYIALTEFSRRVFLRAGFPSEQLTVKPNFVNSDPQVGTGQGSYAVFVGRMSPEKGIDTLLKAWSQLKIPIKLKFIGEGPEVPRVRQAAVDNSRIEWLGQRPWDEVLSLIGEATCLIMPSIWYETFGRTMIEAFAKGTPIIASRLGAMAELVDEGRTGLCFVPGDPSDLAEKVQRLQANPTILADMRCAAREEYEKKYTADINYRLLIDIYHQVLGQPECHACKKNACPPETEREIHA